jgi:hypothetical protein
MWDCEGVAPLGWSHPTVNCSGFPVSSTIANPQLLVAQIQANALGNTFEYIGVAWGLAIATRRRLVVQFAPSKRNTSDFDQEFKLMMAETFPTIRVLEATPGMNFDGCVKDVSSATLLESSSDACADARDMRSPVPFVFAAKVGTVVVKVTKTLLESRNTFGAKLPFGHEANNCFLRQHQGCVTKSQEPASLQRFKKMQLHFVLLLLQRASSRYRDWQDYDACALRYIFGSDINPHSVMPCPIQTSSLCPDFIVVFGVSTVFDVNKTFQVVPLSQ